jgi:hypothetical protein
MGWWAARKQRRELAERQHRLNLTTAELECKMVEAQLRMQSQLANPFYGDKEFTKGMKSLLESEGDFPDRKRLLEGLDYFDSLVDPYDAYRGENGELWDQIASAMYGASEPFLGLLGFRNELELRMARNLSRTLCKENPWCHCILENLVNYIVGSQHTYQVAAKDGEQIPPAIIAKIQSCLDEWCKAVKWGKQQADCEKRQNMDGECIRRFFNTNTGLQVRFVEPWQLATPSSHTVATHAWGVEVDLEDAQTIKAYWIDGQAVNPADVDHRKRNVYLNVRRGIPTFYPIRYNLRRAENLLKNMGLVAQTQASIAFIRSHGSGTTSGQMGAFAASNASVSYTPSTTGIQRNFQRFRPATIIDKRANMDIGGFKDTIDAPAFVEVLQAELRTIAARINMPEFMVSADASNANYSSTMVAEGPSVRSFERWQSETEESDLPILHAALAWHSGRINPPFPPEALKGIEIIVGKPRITARDRLQETQANQILNAAGVMSTQTWSAKEDLDYQQEQANFEDHFDRFGGRPEFDLPYADDVMPQGATNGQAVSAGGQQTPGTPQSPEDNVPMKNMLDPGQDEVVDRPNKRHKAGLPVEMPDDLSRTTLQAIS